MAKTQKKVQKKKSISLPKPGSSQLRKIEDMMERREYGEAALMALDAENRHPNIPDFPEVAVIALIELEQLQEALHPVGRLLALVPNRIKSLHLGAVTYAANGMYAHAVRCFRRIQELEADHPTLDRLKSLMDKGGEIINAAADTLKVSFEEAEEGSFWQEEGNIRRLRGDLPGTVEALGQAVDRLPNAIVPRLLLAEALFLTGKLEESETHSRAALEIEPESIEAGLRLMMIARARYDDEAMRAAYAPLIDREPGPRLAEASALAKAHGLMGEHERAYAITHRVAAEHRNLDAHTLNLLGAAAANTGHTSEAKGFYRLLQKPSAPPSQELDALDIGLPGPYIAPTFAYVGIVELIGLAQFMDLSPHFMPFQEENVPPPPGERDALLAQYPQLLWIGEKFLYEEDVEIGLGILLSLGTDRAVGIVRHLITGAGTPWSVRLKAATALKDHGFWNAGETLAIPFEGRTVEITPEGIEALYGDYALPPDVEAGVVEAAETSPDNRNKAARLLRSLLEKHPDLPILHHNLALLSGREEAESLLRRSLEVRPDYVFARTTLSVMLAGERKVEEAQAVLAELPADKVFSPAEYTALLYARAHLERVQNHLDEAVDLLIQLLREDPDHTAARPMLHEIRNAKQKGLLLLDEKGYWMGEDSFRPGTVPGLSRRG